MLFLLTASLAEAFRVMFQTALCDRVHSNTVTEYFWHESRQQPDLNDITVVQGHGLTVQCILWDRFQ
jgi:hypothetical protein